MEYKEVVEAVLEDLKREAAAVQTAIDYAYQEARSAPASTESWSDGRRREQQQMAVAYEAQKQKIENAITILTALDRNTQPKTPGIGALIQSEINGTAQWYFIVPYAGGRTISVKSETVITLSPESPLGQKLLRLGKS